MCFVVDGASSVRQFVALIMQGRGVDAETFTDGTQFREAIEYHTPNLVILDVGTDVVDAIDSVKALGTRAYSGPVQLMSNRGPGVLERVRMVGEHFKVRMLPTLSKPFGTAAIHSLVQGLQLGHPPSIATRIDLDEALSKGWMEFWFQPKIDLRRKQLAGVEAFARARHPVYGIQPPSAFMPRAGERSLIELARQGLAAVLHASRNFAALGAHIPLSINVPVAALTALPIADIVDEHRPAGPRWAGLILDLSEREIVSELTLASEMARKLDPHGVKLAIDDFGRGFTSLLQLNELPFAELKLDRSFVADCGTDKVNAPICRTVIDLAHNFGSLAVGIGVERAADAAALLDMGCDLGQGFLLGEPMPEVRFNALLRQRATARPTAASQARAKIAHKRG
jgi:EAL domain-containing protein (putative c-di-GMP-specific phosphodiesterase class I)